jgi:GxxExxY protein
MKKKISAGNLLFEEGSYAIIGACFAVYKNKGCGFLEPVYQECLEIEFDFLGLQAQPKMALQLEYRGKILRQTYQPDFICFDKILVEIKAVSGLVDEHRAQVLNYLNASGLQLGLLINFGHHPKLEYQRIVHTH